MGEAGRNPFGQVTYHVECSCPEKTRKVVPGAALTYGSSRSCGCIGRELTSARTKKHPVLPPDCRFKILSEAGRTKHKEVTYHVECSCPAKTRKVVAGKYLTSGNTRSCGCISREMAPIITKNRIRFSDALEEYGHLTSLGDTLDRLEQEIEPCNSESSTRKQNLRRKKTRSSTESSTG